jgi:hypothetical protein
MNQTNRKIEQAEPYSAEWWQIKNGKKVLPFTAKIPLKVRFFGAIQEFFETLLTW